jgi:hypothetical protein
MADQPFPWRKTFILGFRFFGISIIQILTRGHCCTYERTT